ncbi:MAG: MMPL family transporter [Dehalococcoidia bacterium]|nr:MMPL family transporter [Dehalococcoidia bacterium]
MIEKVLLGTWGFIEKRAKLVLILAAILLIVALMGAKQVEKSNTYSDYMKTSSQEYKDLIRLDENFSSDQIIIILEGASTAAIVSDQNLAAMKTFEDTFYELNAEGQKVPIDNVQFVMTPEYVISAAKAKAAAADPQAVLPPNESYVIDPATGKLNGSGRGVFFNETNGMIVLSMKGGLDDDQKHELIKEAENTMEAAGFENVTITVTGSPMVLDYQIQNIPKTVSKIMGIAIISMFIIVALLFKTRGSFAWRWLAVGVVGLAVIFTMGVMGFIGLDTTTVSLAVYPILFGLGADYCIQFHNRYDEEQRKGLSASQSVKNTLSHIGPALVIAMAVAVAGFASVLLSNSPMVVGFGKMLIIGVVMCLVVSVGVLLPILYLKDRKNDATNKPEPLKDTNIDKLASWIAHKAVKYVAILLVIAVGLSAFGWLQESKLEGGVGYKDGLRADSSTMKDLEKLLKLSGGTSSSDLILTVPEGKSVLEPSIMQWVMDREKELLANYGAKTNPGHFAGSASSIGDFFVRTMGALPKDAATADAILKKMDQRNWINSVSVDRTQMHISTKAVSAEAQDKAVMNDDNRKVFANPPEGTEVILTGTTLQNPKMLKDIEDGRTKFTYIGLGFIIAMLLICFRFKVSRVLVAVLPVILILGWSTAIMYARGMHITTVMAVMPAQVMGIGVEFTVLILMRYYEERDKGGLPMDSMVTAMSRIGRAIIVSGTMVAIGFGSMWFAFDYPKLSAFGWITICDMILILLSSLVLLPGIVVKFDDWRDRNKKVAVPVK